MFLLEYALANDGIKAVADDSGVSYTSLKAYAHGKLVVRYDVAKRISEATGGAVTIAELCEPRPRAKKKAPGDTPKPRSRTRPAHCAEEPSAPSTARRARAQRSRAA